jgi:alpha-glucosidase (family GH31 glycosyl hydrolase)
MTIFPVKSPPRIATSALKNSIDLTNFLQQMSLPWTSVVKKSLSAKGFNFFWADFHERILALPHKINSLSIPQCLFPSPLFGCNLVWKRKSLGQALDHQSRHRETQAADATNLLHVNINVSAPNVRANDG